MRRIAWVCGRAGAGSGKAGRALVLEAPFTSAADVGAQHYWFVPVRLFMKDQFRSDLRVSKVTAPVLVVHGENDSIVPITLGERLHGLIRAPKRFVPLPAPGITISATTRWRPSVRVCAGADAQDPRGSGWRVLRLSWLSLPSLSFVRQPKTPITARR
jgi:hypothetical protein